MQASRLQFDRYVLDLGRGCLLLDGAEVALRPKTFGVLRYLAENAGRLVSKEDLFAAVWPSLVVTDDTLVQSIGELRRALGDDGTRIIKSIPRRGYRFEAPVSSVSADGTTALTPAPSARSRSRILRIRTAALVIATLLAGLYFLVSDRAPPAAGAKAAIAILPLRIEGNVGPWR